MTRFHELKRINAALENGDIKELMWAAAYCRTRVQLASTLASAKTTQKYWLKTERKIKAALAQMQAADDIED
jgi:hypothetical protein